MSDAKIDLAMPPAFHACSFQMKNTDGLEREIGVLRNTCDKMADEVEKITKGAGEQQENQNLIC